MILSADQALIINYHSRACSGVGRLVPVGRGLVGSFLVDADVDGLLVSEHGELGAELVQVEAGDLLVEVLGEHVHLLVVLLGVVSFQSSSWATTWLVNEQDMTKEGWPVAQPKLSRRPSARTMMPVPLGNTHLSTWGLMLMCLMPGNFMRRVMSISLSK